MTLIISFRSPDYPVPTLLGDLLTTGPARGERGPATYVPAVGDVTNFFDQHWAINRLAQKVVLISESFAVAWAGSWLGARLAVEGLRTLARDGPPSIDAILSYLHDDPEVTRHDTSFVGFVFNEGHVNHFRVRAGMYRSPVLGDVNLHGTGCHVVPALSEFLTKVRQKAPSGSVGPVEITMLRALIAGGLLLQLEYRGGQAAETLRAMFGGGYEVAMLIGDRFQKLRDTTYVLWEAERETPSISSPRLVVSQTYVDDHLLIRSVRLGIDEATGTALVLDEQRHLVLAMYPSPVDTAKARLRAMPLTFPTMCHNVYVFEGPGGALRGVATVLDRAPEGASPGLAFDESPAGLTMTFSAQLKEKLFSALAADL